MRRLFALALVAAGVVFVGRRRAVTNRARPALDSARSALAHSATVAGDAARTARNAAGQAVQRVSSSSEPDASAVPPTAPTPVTVPTPVYSQAAPHDAEIAATPPGEHGDYLNAESATIPLPAPLPPEALDADRELDQEGRASEAEDTSAPFAYGGATVDERDQPLPSDLDRAEWQRDHPAPEPPAEEYSAPVIHADASSDGESEYQSDASTSGEAVSATLIATGADAADSPSIPASSAANEDDAVAGTRRGSRRKKRVAAGSKGGVLLAPGATDSVEAGAEVHASDGAEVTTPIPMGDASEIEADQVAGENKGPVEGLLLAPEGAQQDTSDSSEDTQPMESTIPDRIQDNEMTDNRTNQSQSHVDARAESAADRSTSQARESAEVAHNHDDEPIVYSEYVDEDRREELESMHLTPHSETSVEDFQQVTASLPPETVEAIKQMEEGGKAGDWVDYPVEEGYSVEALDGKLGSVDSVERPEDGDPYIVVKEGLIFKDKVNVPFEAIERVENETVYLTIEKQYIKLMEGEDTTHTGDTTTRLS